MTPGDLPPTYPSNLDIHANPQNFYSWLATITLNIPTGYKAAIFFKEKCWVSTPFIELVYDLNVENIPHFLGYVYPNERNERMTNIYQIYWAVYEIDDNRNQNRSDHPYSDDIFRRFRRFTDSSVITDREAIQRIADIFAGWDYTKDMWSKVDALRPKTTGTRFFFHAGP